MVKALIFEKVATFFCNILKDIRVLKHFFSNLFKPRYIYKRYFDTFMIFLILISVFILVYEVKHPVSSWSPQYKWIDNFDVYAVTTIFALEYILRFWVYNDLHVLIIREYEESKFLDKPFNVWIPIKKFLKEKIVYLLSPSSTC